MKNYARGYIASGPFNGNRVPQHLQNQIVKSYCDSNGLEFVLSRAEYWINGATMCQLWAALKEGFVDIVFFSLWQLPNVKSERLLIYDHCVANGIVLHFASERIRVSSGETSFADIEILFESNLLMLSSVDYSKYLEDLQQLL